MATVAKDFKVKNGLIVEGSTGTINNYDILTKKQDDQDYIVGLIGGTATSANTADTVVKRDGSGNFSAGTITADLTGDVTGTVSDLSNHDTGDLSEGTNLYYTDARVTTHVQTNLDTDDLSEGTTNKYYTDQRVDDYINNSIDTDDVSEGATNKYYTDARVRDAVSNGDGLNYDSNTGEFSAHLGNGLEFSVGGAIQIDDTIVATETDLTNAISTHNASSGIHGVTGDVVGTTDTQTISNKTLGSNLDAGTYKVTNLGAPENSTDAATKAYVDSVSEGLHIHAAAETATTANITLAPAPATIDGVNLVSGMRVLVKNQSAAAENGIYSFDGTNLVRAADFDQPAEVDGGDFIFVTGGTVNDNTGWVQTSTGVTTIGTDPIYFTQFSGAGTYLAGNGLTLDGNTFEIDETVTATRTYVDTELDAHIDLTANVHGVTGDVVGTSDTQTLTNKTLGSGTLLSANIDAANTYTIENLEEPTSAQDAATKNYVDGEISSVNTTIDNLTTSDIAEGTNLYYTNQRVDDYINASIDTDDVAEGASNLYFTDNRAKDAAGYILENASLTNIQITYDEGAHTLSITAENGVADSDTDDLTEGTTNLYFTNQRAVDALEAVVPNFTEIDINSVATQVAATISAPTASTVTAYQFAHADYRSAKFLVKAETASHTEVSEVLVTLDGSNNVAITEYAIVGTNGNLVDVSADIDGSNVRLRVTTINNSTDVTVVGTLIA